jgi:hypothetical protein
VEVQLIYGLKGNEKHITSRKITNFVKLVRHGDYHIVAVQVQPNNFTKQPV